MSNATRTAGRGRIRPVITTEPKACASVYATRRPDVFHVRVIETAAGEVLRQGSYRLRAANPAAAAGAALWMFNHSQPLPCSGFFVWR